MGKREQERGELLLPSAAVVPLRNALVQAINQQQDRHLDLAGKVHAHLKSEQGAQDRKKLAGLLRGKGGGWGEGPSRFLLELSRKIAEKHAIRTPSYVDDEHMHDDVSRLLLTPPTNDGTPRKIRAPRRKDIPALLASKTWSFSDCDCSIHIDPKTRVVHWSVEEAKNSVERAREGVLGSTFMREIEKIKWTRGTGGHFRYTDEYAQDAAMDYGSNPIHVSGSFGPLGQQEMDARMGVFGRRRAPGR